MYIFLLYTAGLSTNPLEVYLLVLLLGLIKTLQNLFYIVDISSDMWSAGLHGSIGRLNPLPDAEIFPIFDPIQILIDFYIIQ